MLVADTHYQLAASRHRLRSGMSQLNPHKTLRAMWFKPSTKTVALFKKGNFLFLPLWLGVLAYIWLRGADLIPSVWDKLFFPIVIVWMFICAAYTVKALASAHVDSKRAQHPDPDVAALIDKEIDIAEYRRRKEEHAKSE